MTAAAEAGPSASTRVARLMAVSLGVAGLILLGLAVPTIIGESPMLAPWWTVMNIVLILGASVTVIVSGAIGRPRSTTVSFVLLAAVILFGALMAPFAAPAGTLTFDPWLNDLTVIGAAAAAAGLPVPAGIAYLVVTLAAFAGDAMLLAQPALREVLLLHHSQSLFYAALFTALAIASRRAGRMLDDAVRSAVADISTAAAAEARRAQRRRVEALIHDRIIVALLTFGRGDRAADDRASREASRALQAIEELEDPAPVGDPTVRELAWRLQGMTTELDARIRFDYATGIGRVPARVASAAEEAMSEAVRNSLRHAGDRVSRQVSVDVDERRVRVVVLDDGLGFEPTGVEPTRLGISEGIVHRMALVGGRAEVVSRRGRGTTVVLEWSPS
jgi:signal transduction histidine kinase